jgi:hypothetical protein
VCGCVWVSVCVCARGREGERGDREKGTWGKGKLDNGLEGASEPEEERARERESARARAREGAREGGSEGGRERDGGR